METGGVKIKYRWEIFNRIFLTIWILTRFYNNFFDSVILYICGVLTADYFYNSKKSGDNDEKLKGLLSPTWLSPRHSPISPRDFLISEDLHEDNYESDEKKTEIPIKAQKFFFNEGTRKRRYLNVGKVENISKESSEKIQEGDASTTITLNDQSRELSDISKILREDPNWIEDTSDEESDDDSSEIEDETDNDKNALAPMSWLDVEKNNDESYNHSEYGSDDNETGNEPQIFLAKVDVKTSSIGFKHAPLKLRDDGAEKPFIDFIDASDLETAPNFTFRDDGAEKAFIDFIDASDLETAQKAFFQSCKAINLEPCGTIDTFYTSYREAIKPLVSYRYSNIWKILDKKTEQTPYKGLLGKSSKVVVVGAGPCGLRTGIETQLLGATTVVLEKREEFTRNNVLKLWKFCVEDLKLLGIKKFYGHFSSGDLNHISIKVLQLVLTKVAMLLGIRIIEPCTFVDLIEPTEGRKTWRAKVEPQNDFMENYDFDFLVIASGRNVPIEGFARQSLDAKLAIAVTANFVNNRTAEDTQSDEIAGLAYQYHQKFFRSLKTEMKIDLENIVYFRSDTHYFVMTAKKDSLLERGVIKKDTYDRDTMLRSDNIDRKQLEKFAIDASQYSTDYYSSPLNTEEFALNGRGQPDIDVFDFTNLYSATHACRIKERKGCKLLMTIVGDSLLEPFWPQGTGAARGFLSAFDAAWMFRRWVAAPDANPLELIAERHNIYRLLSRTVDGKNDDLHSRHKSYTIDPSTRYKNIPKKIDHDRTLEMYDTDQPEKFSNLKQKFLKIKNISMQ